MKNSTWPLIAEAEQLLDVFAEPVGAED